MIQCSDCEFFDPQASGSARFMCDPFSNVKEPQCIAKWQLMKIQEMLDTQQATLNYYQSLAPMQQKMFSMMQREMDGLDESESWKEGLDSDSHDFGDDLMDDEDWD